MSQAYAATGADRLPWLADEPAPARERGKHRELAGWAVAAMLLVAGASYWAGKESAQQPMTPEPPAQVSTTVPLPVPQIAMPPQPQVVPQQQPEILQLPQTQVRIDAPAVEQRPRPSAKEETAAAPTSAADASATPQVAPAIAVPPVANVAPMPRPTPPMTRARAVPWPAYQSQGATGRIVRIGAFGTRQQAKLGWRRMVRAYPAVGRLRATVVETRNSRGRRFYRFQMGTTSPAHSEVLCQWMKKISFSCAVVGLPVKPNGIER